MLVSPRKSKPGTLSLLPGVARPGPVTCGWASQGEAFTVGGRKTREPMYTRKVKEGTYDRGRRFPARFHCCAFDRECWSHMREFGAPMRLHLRSKTLMREWVVDIPILTRMANRISDETWANAKPVKIEVRGRKGID